jgi:hypothetical protein
VPDTWVHKDRAWSTARLCPAATDLVIFKNSIYLDEIGDELASMGVEAELVGA